LKKRRNAMIKKMLVSTLMVIALAISASAALPDWVENMNPGDSYTTGAYSGYTAFAEPKFTPTTFSSGTNFGQSVTGGVISQSVATSITGGQLGDVDRQYMGAAGSGFVATYAAGTYFDPENPTTSVIADMGMTKTQFADFSGALVPGLGQMKLTSGPTDLNGDSITDDAYGGSHGLQFYSTEGANPSWTATYNDAGTVGITKGTQLHQSLTNAAVTIKANSYANVPAATDVFMIVPTSGCDGAGEIWKGYSTGVYSPYPDYNAPAPYTIRGQTKLVEGTASNPATLDQLRELSLIAVPHNAQLTELGSTSSSDVSLQMTYTTGTDAPVTTIAGSNSLGASWAQAKLDPGVKLVVDYTAPEAFNYWYT
jgi:hypothetical protein